MKRTKKAKRNRILFLLAVRVVFILSILIFEFKLVNSIAADNMNESELYTDAAKNLDNYIMTYAPTTEISHYETMQKIQTNKEIKSDNTSYDAEFFSDDLFIGDSIATGFYLYDKLDRKNIAAKVGYTPYKACNEEIELYNGSSATALDYASQMQPKRIYIMLGSNGLGSEAAMEESYRTLVESLKENCPNSELYCISVTPLTSDSSAGKKAGIDNEMVNKFNNFIENICDENDIMYLDFYSLVSDNDGYFMSKYAEEDGIHFKAITYDTLLNFIHTKIS